jgi:ABC-type multidrug transport system fused ATPase/permease subunit
MRNTQISLIRGHRLRYGAAIGAMALGTLFGLGVPLVTMAVLDGVLTVDTAPSAGDTDSLALTAEAMALVRELTEQHGSINMLWWAGAAIVLLTALSGLCHYLRSRWAAMASEAVVRNLRDRLYGHLDRLPCATHDRSDTGDLVQRCTSDVETLRVFLAAQVVEIARAALLLLIAVPIMDEATSSIDTETEREIQRALVHVLAGRTSFVIAHRLSTVRTADRILVIDAGRIVEQGGHSELMHRRGRYHDLAMRQALRESDFESSGPSETVRA